MSFLISMLTWSAGVSKNLHHRRISVCMSRDAKLVCTVSSCQFCSLLSSRSCPVGRRSSTHSSSLTSSGSHDRATTMNSRTFSVEVSLSTSPREVWRIRSKRGRLEGYRARVVAWPPLSTASYSHAWNRMSSWPLDPVSWNPKSCLQPCMPTLRIWSSVTKSCKCDSLSNFAAHPFARSAKQALRSRCKEQPLNWSSRRWSRSRATNLS